MRKYSVSYTEWKLNKYPFLPPFGHKHHNVNSRRERSAAGSTQTSQRRISVVGEAIIGPSDSQHRERQRQLVKHGRILQSSSEGSLSTALMQACVT